MLSGIDFSYGSGLTTAQIKAKGVSFVCRYLSGGGSKDIDAKELANYTADGILVVFVWETTGLMPSEGQGVADANAAQSELDDLGCKDAVVFFAADAESVADLAGYLNGAASVLGKARVGIYGGLGSVSAAFDQGLVTYGWQTYAWSSGQWDDRALIRQVSNGVNFGPATVDLDTAAYWNSTDVLATTDDFGQWPRPTAPPKPVSSTVAVPDVMGRASSTARKLIEEAGLVVSAPAVTAGDTATVRSQSPVSGTKVDKGATVTLTLDVVNMVQVPSLVGLSMDAAAAALSAAGLKEYSPSVKVSAQSPAASATVSEGSTIRITLEVVAVKPTPTPAPTPPPAPVNPTPPPAPQPVAEPELHVGMSGNAVKLLQHVLNTKDHSGLIEDGMYGTNTENAVRKFQTKNGLAADGVCGPDTWRKLGDYS